MSLRIVECVPGPWGSGRRLRLKVVECAMDV